MLSSIQLGMVPGRLRQAQPQTSGDIAIDRALAALKREYRDNPQEIFKKLDQEAKRQGEHLPGSSQDEEDEE